MSKIYAMLLDGYVIDVVEADEVPVYPPGINGEVVVAKEVSNKIRLGLRYDENTSSFVEDTKVPEKSQLDIIQEQTEKTADELRQEGANSVLEELQKRGVL